MVSAAARASSTVKAVRVARLLEAQLLQQLLKPLAVFGQIDGVGRSAEDLGSGLFQRYGQIERCLAAELDDDPLGLFGLRGCAGRPRG